MKPRLETLTIHFAKTLVAAASLTILNRQVGCFSSNTWTTTKLKKEQQQMVEAKKNERANALKEVKRLCKEFGFTAGMLKGALAEGRKK